MSAADAVVALKLVVAAPAAPVAALVVVAVVVVVLVIVVAAACAAETVFAGNFEFAAAVAAVELGIVDEK